MRSRESLQRVIHGGNRVLALIVPVYKNEANLDRLLVELEKLNGEFRGELETVFVIDGSPDRSYDILRSRLPALPLRCRIVCLSRNFGSFAAVLAGLLTTEADYYASMAADLQEPPEMILEFWNTLRQGEADVVFGYRTRRSDPLVSALLSRAFRSEERR